ncbi:MULTISPECIES: MvdC/MvdD family ATP grasp protein [unclassified Chryseobacterium]|uniref:MvdC/MvdD family ATP grasp protein n=1 Tax=unclassified Chryseobacterium TaxID=2593645 RepID=UPI003018016D
MILILTDKNDIHADVLIKKLNSENSKYFRFNLDTFSLEKTFVNYDGNEWIIFTNNEHINLKDVHCVWNRRTFVQLMLDEQNGTHEFNIWKNEWNKTLLGIYYHLKDKKWLNYYRDNHKAENKYLQLDLAKNLGFTIPDFILSNKKESLISFAKKHKKIVLKLMNQDFYKIDKNKFMGFYVNIISEEDLSKFSDFEENPIFLQKYIDKLYEVRYTVVNEEHFVCKIDSQKSEISNIDWRRYDIANTPHSIINPPEIIRDKVNQFMKHLNLKFGALDFIVDKNNNWHLLEINPSGQYLWIEDLTGLRITDAIKKYLISL